MRNYTVEQIYETNIEKLFDIIFDVEKYPEFLPWCIATKIISEDSQSIYADLMINFQGINEQYTSKITHIKPHLIIAEAVKGPFKILNNTWKLESIDKNRTNVKFDIEFEFKSKILDRIIGFMYEKAISKMTQAFIDRAKSSN